MTQLLPALHRSFSAVSRTFLAAVALSLVSCVSPLTPDQAAIEVTGAKGPLAVSVADHRKEVGLMRKDRYYGHFRGTYGIPNAVIDLKMPVADRLALQIQSGLKKQGISAEVITTKRFEKPGHPAPADRKTLTVQLNNVWVDFASPLFNNESILYFDATAQVLAPGGRVQASATRSFTRNFRYDRDDSFPNQAIRVLQPEFTRLVNDPAIRKALATP